LIVYAFLFGLT